MRFKIHDQVSWRVGSREYRGRVSGIANSRAVQVKSRDGFRWLLPIVELDRVP